MTILAFLITSLAIWRLTYMVVEEDGPGNIFLKLRESASSDKQRLWLPFNCFYCASVWVSAIVCLLLNRPFIEIFAYSGTAIFLYVLHEGR